MRNVGNVLRHELIGLKCEVIASANASHVGVRGMIEDETLKTLVIGGRRVFKKGSVFRITVADHAVEVEGGHLLTRPEDRIKKKIRKW